MSDFTGMDLSHAKLVLKSLAKFHGAGLCIKQKDSIDQKKIQKYSEGLTSKSISNNEQYSLLTAKLKNEKILDDFQMGKLKKSFELSERQMMKAESTADSLWTCIIHEDLWTNNMLFRHNDLGQPEDVKFVDFQTYSRNSSLRDLIFFLSTSIQLELVKNNFDDLIEFYRLELMEVLKELNYDNDFVTCKKTFYERLKIDAYSELYHIFFMLKFITLDEGEQFEDSRINQLHFDKYKEILLIWVSHGWL